MKHVPLPKPVSVSISASSPCTLPFCHAKEHLWAERMLLFEMQAQAVNEELSWVRQQINAMSYRGGMPAEPR